MVTDAEMIMEVLRTIPDPEMPVSIVDLGLIEHIDVARAGGRVAVTITVLPTFVGCPALDMIAREITEKVRALPTVDQVEVEFINDPPWSVDRITEEGRAELRAHGVTVPDRGGNEGPKSREELGGLQAQRAGAWGNRLPMMGRPAGEVALRTSAIPCPFCDSRETRIESTFGPTRCRMIYYCDACRNTFEHMKRV